MQREEHYCDRCGAQMTAQDEDGDTACYGITVLAQTQKEAPPVEANFIVDTNMPTSSGSLSTRHQLHGTEFCSFGCFHSAMLTLINEIAAWGEPR